MLQVNSRVKIADNSGAKEGKIIGIPGYSKRRFVSTGDLVVIAVTDAIPHGTIKMHQVQKAVIVRTTKEIKRKDGSHIRFDDNAAVILDGSLKGPRATRVFGPIARELKDRGYDKIISLAPEVL